MSGDGFGIDLFGFLEAWIHRVSEPVRYEIDPGRWKDMCDEIDRLRLGPVVDHDNQTVEFLIGFDWDRHGIHMDNCEVAGLAGDLQRLLVAHYTTWPQIAAVHPVRTYEPNEDWRIGSVQHKVVLHKVEP